MCMWGFLSKQHFGWPSKWQNFPLFLQGCAVFYHKQRKRVMWSVYNGRIWDIKVLSSLRTMFPLGPSNARSITTWPGENTHSLFKHPDCCTLLLHLTHHHHPQLKEVGGYKMARRGMVLAKAKHLWVTSLPLYQHLSGFFEPLELLEHGRTLGEKSSVVLPGGRNKD